MYNLLVSGYEESWNSSPYKIEKNLVFEYTDEDIKVRYSLLDEKSLNELGSLPTLFMVEGELLPTRFGRITSAVSTGCDIKIKFDSLSLVPLRNSAVRDLRYALDITKDFEFNRTHWAVKDVDLLEVLINKSLVSQDQVDSLFPPTPIPPLDKRILDKTTYNQTQIFLVHGQDRAAMGAVEGFIKSLKLDPVILQSQPSNGLTIIEKLEEYTAVGFGIVLYTPCDIGAKKGSIDFSYRARQNVVFEHGFLMGKLGRARVIALTNGEIEHPSDISGIVYISMSDDWQERIKNELQSSGYSVN